MVGDDEGRDLGNPETRGKIRHVDFLFDSAGLDVDQGALGHGMPTFFDMKPSS